MSDQLKNMIIAKTAELAIVGAVLWGASLHKKYKRALRDLRRHEEDLHNEELYALQVKVKDLEAKAQPMPEFWHMRGAAFAQKLKDAPPYPDAGGAEEV